MSKTTEHEWTVELPAATADQLLAALAARDRIFGQSLTLEPEDELESIVEVLLGAAEGLDGTTFSLLISAEITGADEYLEAATDALDDIVGELIEEGASDAAQATLLGRYPAAGITFRKVAEEDERPQLIIPEWLAPEEIDLPWSFRGFDAAGMAWPSDELVDANERLVVLPVKDEFLLYALPALPEAEEDDEIDGDDLDDGGDEKAKAPGHSHE